MPRPSGPLADALADVDSLGGFFALATGPAQGVDPSWRPLAELTGDVLDARIDAIAEQLGGIQRRIAGSLLALSVSARMTALVLGTAALHGAVPRLHDRLHWRPWSGGPAPLWLPEPEPLETADAATATREIERSLRPTLESIGSIASVSDQVLWGNVASSVGGALRVLLTERPQAGPAAGDLATAVVGNPPLAGLGEFVPAPEHPTGIRFERRTCCLFYRVPGGGTCGDCVLVK